MGKEKKRSKKGEEKKKEGRNRNRVGVEDVGGVDGKW